jgi:hypothetical protein
MKILRRRELGPFSATIFIFSLLFLPAIVGFVFWGHEGCFFGMVASLVLFFSNIVVNCLDGRFTCKIKAKAKIHSIHYAAKVVQFEFNREVVSSRLSAYDAFFSKPRKPGEMIPVLVTVGKVTRTIQEISPLVGQKRFAFKNSMEA